jgi:hypothetical protein
MGIYPADIKQALSLMLIDLNVKKPPQIHL